MDPPRHTETYQPDSARTPEGALARALEPGEILGHFEVIGLIGSGGMGDVYAARDATLDRMVALKVLRQAGQGRFLREAQALGRVVHPNVVTVFEAGELDGRLFIAMEHVDGETLKGWLGKARTWREIVALFLEAGQGLVAVHRHHLVHRDFKPENVLVGKDGRVRVSDFGVVGLAGVSAAEQDDTPSAMALDLTRTGSNVGTPIYMAPEQHTGGVVDERTDQFAFAVSLYRALYRRAPFAGRSYAELRDNVVAGNIVPPPRRGGVPRWLERVVLRGLEPEPEARFPTLPAMLDQLRRGPRVTAPRVGLGLAVPLAAVAVLWGATREQTSPCQGVSIGVAPIWNDATRRAIELAFTKSGRPYAADTARKVEEILDRYTSGWAGDRIAACHATLVRHELSPELHDARVACLERRLDGLRALTRVLVAADADIVDRAVSAAMALDPPEDCSASRLLGAKVPARRSPETIAFQQRLDAAAAEIKAGKARAVLPRMAAMIADGRQLGDKALLAEALVMHGRAAVDKEPATALAALQEAVALTGELDDDDLAARALLELFKIVGLSQGRASEALNLRPAVEAAVRRTRNDRHRITLLQTLGNVEFQAGKYSEAIATYDEELALIDRAEMPETLEQARALRDRGKVLAALMQNDAAVASGRQALAIAEKILGPDHLDLAIYAGTLGIAEWRHRHYAEAEALFRRMLKISEDTLGPESIKSASALANLATVANDQGKFAEALAWFERALAIQEKLTGADSAQVATILNNMSFSLVSLGRVDDALAAQRRALAIREKVLPPTHPDIGASLLDIGMLLRDKGQLAEALPWLERAVAIDEKGYPPGHPDTVNAATILALAYAESRQPARALAAAERIRATLPADADALTRAHADLATALSLHAAGRDPARAEPLARAAVAALAGEPSERRTVERARKLFHLAD